MLYEITVAGLEHLELGSSISVLTEICQARKRKNQLFQKLLELQTERKNLETTDALDIEPENDLQQKEPDLEEEDAQIS